MELIFFTEQLLNGLLVGGYYLLIALGLSLIFSLGGIVNLSHGAFYALGAYGAVMMTDQIGFLALWLLRLCWSAYWALLLNATYSSLL